MGQSWTCLIRIKGKDGLRSHLIEKPSFTIGRTQDADLPITDQSVSRLHLTVVIKDELVWVTDEHSANGTYLNGKRLNDGETLAVAGGDVLTLGTLPTEFCFLAFPKPYELLGVEQKNQVLRESMEEVAAKIEARSRQQAEAEIKKAKGEVEQLLAAAKRDAEVVKTKELVLLQNRRQEFENEIAELKQKAQLLAAEDRSRAVRDTDLILSEAQKKMQQDYEDCNQRIQLQLKNHQELCSQKIEEAESKAAALLREARDEAARIRVSATDEARVAQQIAMAKGSEILKENQEKVQREVGEKRQLLLERVEAEGERERARITKEHESYKELLKSQVQSTESQVAKLKTDQEALVRDNSQLEQACISLRSEAAEARKLMATVNELEARRATAESELANFKASRAAGLEKVEAEIKGLRDRLLVDYERQKSEQEKELVKSRLRVTQETQGLISAEEKRFHESRRLRALDLGQRLYDCFVPRLAEWAKAPNEAQLQLKKEILENVERIVVGEVSTFQFSANAVAATPEQKNKKRRLHSGLALAVGLCALAAGVIWGPQLLKSLELSQVDSGAGRMLEERRIQSIYTPEQNDEYRENYTDNVLYMRGYLETKTDPNVRERWTLKLNNLEFQRSLGLSEEDIVQFLSKETNLVERLKTLRGAIDKVYLEQGINRMRTVEDDDLKEIKAALKGDAHYQAIRKVEHEFIEAQIKSSTH